ncbi:hypothetical protein F9C07_2276858 [Aspergillus flavus]|uniref:C2H2-type domain-containing protein n=1 Tax=Aspergillus flavus (strain ATCC 200026 / FGSC A1120 / IAM 13836 / NRRL 3357 / JCM 12722 / SRRC 167) TaxID=332952 RepID=A0A7U2QSN8_ASPFN|nr:hypothetical protein F9C07_2276858 [Aspergillus flavus]
MSVGRKPSVSLSPNSLSTPTPSFNPGPVGLSFVNSDIDLLPEDLEHGLWPYQEGLESHTLLHSPSMQSYISLDDLSMTPHTTTGREMDFDSNVSADVDLRSSQSALGSEIYPEFQAQDIASENLSWYRQGNIVSHDFGTYQNDPHLNGHLNGRLIQLDPAMQELLRVENHIVDRRMGRSTKKARRNLRCTWKGCKYKKQFNRSAELERHVRTIHLFPYSYQCTYGGCLKRFNRKDNLKEHMIRRHNVSF